jgi:hypothetical protein
MKTSKFAMGVMAFALCMMAENAFAATCVGSCGKNMSANGDVAAPPGSTTYSWISTYGGVNGAGEIATVGGTDGSSLTTSPFSAIAGQNLRYYFNFISSDGQSVPGSFVYEDYTFVQLVDLTSGQATMLFNARAEPTGLIVPGQGLPAIDPGVSLTPANSVMTLGSGTQGNQSGGPAWAPLGPSATGFSGWCWGPGCGFSGWIRSDYMMPSSGTYELVFGVTNWGDTVYDSGLAFSGLNIGGNPIEDAIPEPGTWAMLIVGFAGLGLAGFRASRRSKSGA